MESTEIVDIANELGCNKLVLWLAREGTLCYESKDPILSVNRIVEAINKMLEYDKNIQYSLKPSQTSL